MYVKVNVDTFRLTGDNLQSVHQEPDEDEEMIFAQLYGELMAADTRSTRSQRGHGRGVPVGRGKGLIIRPTSTSTGSATQMYTRRASTSTPLPREPSFDDEGNLISEDESDSAPSLPEVASSENSLDELSHSDSAGANDDDDDSDSSS